MAKSVGIRWTKSRQDDLKREIRNYNRRIKRAQQKNPTSLLPQTLRYSEVSKKINTAQELRNLIYDLRQATAENLTPDKSGQTRYQRQLEKRQAGRKAKSPIPQFQSILPKTRSRAELLNKIDLEAKTGRLPTERDWLIRKIGLKEGQSPREMENRIGQWLDERNNAKTEAWRQNYLKTVQENMNQALLAGDVEAYDLLNTIYTTVALMPLENYLIAQLVSGEKLSIPVLYLARPDNRVGMSNDERLGNYSLILHTWEEYY